MKQKIFFTIYIALSISVIGVQLAHLNFIQIFLKPLLMPTLILGYFCLIKNRFKTYDYLIISAFVFSLFGDIFLMPNINIFMAGLASFLLGHIFYLIAFIPEIKKPILLTKKKIYLAITGFAFYSLLIISLVWKLNSISAPITLILAIVIYATVLFSVFLSALLRNTSTAKSQQLILIGAALFLLSDGLLAFNKFISPIPLSRLWVMGTYTGAQAYIMYGSLKRH